MATTPLRTHPSVMYKTKPMKHQARCLKLHGDAPAFALSGDMGTGKTWIILNNAAQLWRRGLCNALLVFAPNGVQIAWIRKQLPAHMPDDVHWLAASWSSENTKAERQKVDDLLPTSTTLLRILTMNWEALATKKGQAIAQQFAMNSTMLMIACDESDWIGNPSALRTKGLMSLQHLSTWRRNLTGTPTNGSPYPLFSQYQFLDPRILNSPSYWAFKAEHAVMMPPHHPMIKAIVLKHDLKRIPQIEERDANGRPIYRNLDRLTTTLAPYTFRVLKKDCLDLPPKVYKPIYFKLTKEQRAVYRTAEYDLRLAYNGEVTTFHRIAIETKLAQITSGYFLHPDAGEPVRIPGKTPRMDLLIEQLKAVVSAGRQAIVWARYSVQIEDVAAACAALNIRPCTYYGQTKKDARTEAREAFQRGEIPVFIGNQQAGGTGIDLFNAYVTFYFSNDFSLRNREQSEDRVHRKGLTHTATYVDFIAEDTIDEAVVESLTKKKDVSASIMNAIQRKGR
jgi:Superfamily II DNA/RNA helicases, SNF2 family